MKQLIVILLMVLSVFGANIPKNFDKAKEMSIRLYHTNHLLTFYTNTELEATVRIRSKMFPKKSTLSLRLDLVDNPYYGTKYKKRGETVEWEHITPASWFKSANQEIFNAWELGNEQCVTRKGNVYKGRKCAQKVSKLFNLMEADMYNLVPVIGALNAMRSDKEFGIIEGEKREFGNIDIEINKSTIEVSENKRGDVARVLLYMNDTYGVQFPNHSETLQMLYSWNFNDPEDEWEVKKKKLLTKHYNMIF
ncbi:MAG TPA: hypothetical protein EYO73_02915 [Sulfurimonas sp.]|nr:hypothetical protein [Sulfurimonas sp.]